MKYFGEIVDNKDLVTKEYVDRKHILDTKTYTNVIGTAASWAGASFAYGKLKPNNFFLPWHIRLKITVNAEGSNYAHATSELVIDGVQDTYMSYSAQNAIHNTSYRPIYYHMYYCFKQAAIEAGGCHYIGFSFLYSWSYTTAANSRTIKIELLELENCDFEFLDSLITHTTVTGYSNYYTYTNFDFASNGLQETGDADQANYQNRIYYVYSPAKETIYRYQCLLRAPDGELIPVSNANNTFTIGKTYTTQQFDPFGEIYFYNTTGTVNVGASVGNATLYRQILADLRYAFDVDTGNNKLLGSKPLYLTARPLSNGMAILEAIQGSIHGPLAQALPTSEDGLIYIYLGNVYLETNPYRVELMINHPVYWYKDGVIQPYTRNNAVIDDVGISTDPYFFRPSPKFSGATYSKERDKVVGGSVGWNQLGTTRTGAYQGITATADASGAITLSGTTTSSYTNCLAQAPVTSGHKMLMTWRTLANPNSLPFRPTMNSAVNNKLYSTNAVIMFVSTTGSGNVGFDQMTSGADYTGLKLNINLFDLTQMFGSTIADHAYSLEQSTSGKGVEFISKLIDLTSYHAYDSGSIKSVEGLESHDMVGKNLFSQTWTPNMTIDSDGTVYSYNNRSATVDPCRIIGGQTYTLSYTGSGNNGVFYYDENDTFISFLAWGAKPRTFTAPSNAYYVRFSYTASTPPTDAQLELGSTATAYEPYVKHSYPLDSSLTLRGVPKLSNGAVYYDGDVYEPDGTVTRKYGVVDLGTLSWTLSGQIFKASLPNGYTSTANTTNCVCPKYIATASVANGNMWMNQGNINIVNSAYQDATAFKTAMNGVMLVYELATSTTETAEPYTNPQSVDPYGTEEYVTSGLVAVGHETEYLYLASDYEVMLEFASDAKTVNGHTVNADVPTNAVFTDTVTTVTTTGNGNAVTAISATNGALIVAKDTTFLTSHQDISGKADKATTLAGYGITDAKIASGVITLGSNTITPLTSSSTLSAAKLSGAIPSAVTATTQASTDNSTKIATTAFVQDAMSGKQDTLVSGTNIKTVNNESLLGSGNISISGGLQNLVDGSATGSVRGTSTTAESSSYTMGSYAFAEGLVTMASGNCSHAEGGGAEARGNSSHAEGFNSIAIGSQSHAQNEGTIASKKSQTAIGTYNIEDISTTTTHTSQDSNYGKYAVIIGNGADDENPSNALTVDWSGNVDIASGAHYKINGINLSASDVGATLVQIVRW